MISDYHVEVEKVPSKPGCWDVLNVKILKQGKQIGFYQRNYSSFFQTFYPFEQDGKEYALYSKDYTGTRVMSLPDCVDICGEEHDGYGFCPTEFYVPSQSKGKYGFVAGCVWGDDQGGDKLQFLDLSNITKGIFKRDDRFGYIELPDSLKDCVVIDDWDDEREPYLVEIKELKRYRLHDTKENIAWNRLFEELPIGEGMLKLMKHLEKYCTKCGLYSKPRTYLAQKVNEDGSKEMIEKEFEKDEFACKCWGCKGCTCPVEYAALDERQINQITGSNCPIHRLPKCDLV